MRLKYKILILHIFIIYLTLLFMFLIYDSYKLNQNNRYENQINQIITINKEFMNTNLSFVNGEVQKLEPLFLMIEKTLNATHRNLNMDVLKLKEYFDKELDLKKRQLSMEVFRLNKNYKIVQSSNSFDLGYDISVNENEKNTLDMISAVNEMKQSKGVFFDSFDQTIKKYAFLKLDDSSFIGVSLIFEFSKKHKESFNNLVQSLHSKLNYQYVITNTNGSYYTMPLFINKDSYKSRAEYYKSLESKKEKSLQELSFIESSKQRQIYSMKKENSLYTYIPLLEKNNLTLPIFADVILEIKSDTSYENDFFQKTYDHIVYFVLIHIVMIMMIFYFTTSYQNLETNLKRAIHKNHELIKYNKNFVANMVHQIRTPMAVIMSNLSFLEYFSNDKNRHSLQINASITTLSNSYENLSYINSAESLLYKKKRINLSEFLKNRVSYFDSAADASQINLITNIGEDVFFEINDIELERIFDNNIINMVKYSYPHRDAYVTLKKDSLGVTISFKNFGCKITNEKILFEKIIEQEDRKQVCLGLCIVKMVTNKYNIDVMYKRENDFNIFEYHFKNLV